MVRGPVVDAQRPADTEDRLRVLEILVPGNLEAFRNMSVGARPRHAGSARATSSRQGPAFTVVVSCPHRDSPFHRPFLPGGIKKGISGTDRESGACHGSDGEEL